MRQKCIVKFDMHVVLPRAVEASHGECSLSSNSSSHSWSIATNGGVVGWGPFVELCGLIFVTVMVMMVTNRPSQ
jgi:hypothetical protein